VPLKLLLEESRTDDVKEHAKQAKKMFIEGIQRLEGLAEDAMLQAQIIDLGIAAEKISWTNYEQLTQLTQEYKKIKEKYS